MHSSSTNVKGIAPPHQVTLVSSKTLATIETITKNLYPEFKFESIETIPKNISRKDIDRYKDMKF